VLTSYFLGLDLGLAPEYTALAALERTKADAQGPGRYLWKYAVRHLERFPIGTSYDDVLKRVLELVKKLPRGAVTLVADQTGVGAPVVEVFRRPELRGMLRRVVITAAPVGSHENGLYTVPKREIASALQILFQSRRLHIAQQLTHAELLSRELMAFRPKVRITSMESTEEWREKEHDDLVLAVGLPVWMAERDRPVNFCAGPPRVLYPSPLALPFK
jgi:hypothetical protein